MIGYVYITVNEINNILYIGKRQSPVFQKWYKGSGTHLKLAFKKYGKDKFHTEPIEWCSTAEELCEAEKKWIAFYRAQGRELYNVSNGGDGGDSGVSWRSLSEARQLEILRKNSDSHKGSKNPFFGKHHSVETKEILREKNRKNKCPRELAEYKAKQREKLPPVAQLDKKTGELIAIWDNWCDASKHVSPNNRCGYAHIGECCRNERKSAYGYRWEFAEKGWRL